MNNRFKDVRKAMRLTLKQVGDALGISESSVSNIERGRNNPSGSTLTLFCDKFGINRHWLETGEGEMFHAKPEPDPEYPPIIQAALRSYMRLNAQERSALDKFLDALVAEYGDAAKRKAHDDLIDRLSGGETAAAPNGQRVPIITGEHDSVTMARYLAQQDQADLAAEEIAHPVAAENS